MQKIISAIFILIFGISVFGCGTDTQEKNSQPVEEKNISAENNPDDVKVSEEKNKPVEPFKPVVISFAGDCTLGTFLGSDNAFESYWKYGAEYYLGNVKSIFAADDVTFVNLEGPLTKNPQTLVDKQFPMRGEPKYVDILKVASVEICNLSNNHIYDCGEIGFQDTVDLLKANDIKFCGEGFFDVIEVRGMKIGFLGYQGWYDEPSLREKISADIKKLREDKKAEIVIVEFHWGIERDYFGIEDQRTLAHFTIDSGADIVVGSHAHVLQGIEIYNDKLIAYGLGNFCFGANNNPSDKDTMILQTTLDRQDGKISIATKVIPCRISSTNAYNDFCPTPVEGYEAERILNKISKSSSIFPQTIKFQ